MQAVAPVIIHNSDVLPLSDLPTVPFDRFRKWIVTATAGGSRISSLFGLPGDDRSIRLIAVIANDSTGTLALACSELSGDYQALTPDCPQAHLFECELSEQFCCSPTGHPWLKPVRQSYRTGTTVVTPENAAFYRVDSMEVHEVAVGPVHAGIIEPSHFRFQCSGEEILHCEIRLGFQHRGIETVLEGGPDVRTIHYLETVSGDSSVGHALAGCQALEALGGCTVPTQAEVLRCIALELERMANHTGDLGAMAQDIGYLPTASFCGRLRGEILAMTALLCGSRLGRGIIRPGGTGFDCEPARAAELVSRLDAVMRDVTGAVELLWNTASVLDRFEGAGALQRETCDALGLVGPPARACGAERDCRYNFPSGMYRFAHIPLSISTEGDVYARASVRWLELQRSAAFVRERLLHLPGGPISGSVFSLKPNALCVSLVEGWRGEICHAIITDAQGRIARYKIVDPSFHNWFGLAMAMRGEQISDFPLCNKSFNLSYCGHDL